MQGRGRTAARGQGRAHSAQTLLKLAEEGGFDSPPRRIQGHQGTLPSAASGGALLNDPTLVSGDGAGLCQGLWPPGSVCLLMPFPLPRMPFPSLPVANHQSFKQIK